MCPWREGSYGPEPKNEPEKSTQGMPAHLSKLKQLVEEALSAAGMNGDTAA